LHCSVQWIAFIVIEIPPLRGFAAGELHHAIVGAISGEGYSGREFESHPENIQQL